MSGIDTETCWLNKSRRYASRDNLLVRQTECFIRNRLLISHILHLVSRGHVAHTYVGPNDLRSPVEGGTFPWPRLRFGKALHAVACVEVIKVNLNLLAGKDNANLFTA